MALVQGPIRASDTILSASTTCKKPILSRVRMAQRQLSDKNPPIPSCPHRADAWTQFQFADDRAAADVNLDEAWDILRLAFPHHLRHAGFASDGVTTYNHLPSGDACSSSAPPGIGISLVNFRDTKSSTDRLGYSL